MLNDVKIEALKRLRYVSGHLSGVGRMVENDTYCVDVLKQTHAIRRAIEKFEMVLLDGHLRSCVSEGIRKGHEGELIEELVELYQVSNR